MNRISKDDIRTLVVVITVCIICVGLVIILSIKSNSDKLEVVNEYNTFFSTTNYVNTYLSNISNKNNKVIYDLLDKKYKNDNAIDEINIFNAIDMYPEDVSLYTSRMEYVKVGNSYIYYVKGKLIQNILDGKKVIDENFEIVVITDFENLSVSLYPLKNENYKKIIDNIKNINIARNENNAISDSNIIAKEQICVMYLSDYLDKIANDFTLSYELLTDNMKEKHPTEEQYKKYVNSNLDKLTTVANKCKLEEMDDNRLYTIIDKNDNIYVFTEESIMNYKVDVYYAQ